MRIGFVGLGIMGRRMAENLQAAGHTLFVNSCAGVPEELRARGAQAYASGKQVAQASDIVFIMVPDTSRTEQVLFGRGGVAEGLMPGKVVVHMSSDTPLVTKDFAAHFKECGCDYLDFPVSGGEIGADEEALTIMVGGSKAAFDRVRPILEVTGRDITLVGGE